MIQACPVTGFSGAVTIASTGGDYRRILCKPLGGEYRISGSAVQMVEALSPAAKAKLALWLIDQLRLGADPVLVTSNVLQEAVSRPRMAVMDRVHRLYRFLGHRLVSIGKSLAWYASSYSSNDTIATVDEIRVAARAWTESSSDDELDALTAYGFAQSLLSEGKYSGEISLSIDGWRLLEQLNQADAKSGQAFVAMWFGDEVASAYADGIAPAIREAGYIPMRIDQKEHANRIDDEIIAEIRRSRFVVADFTCGVVDDSGNSIAIPRGGVYYEAGFAQGLGIPVIWMCRQDHINHVHFDTRQFNHITWTDAADLRSKLKNRIGAVLGDGPHASR